MKKHVICVKTLFSDHVKTLMSLLKKFTWRELSHIKISIKHVLRTVFSDVIIHCSDYVKPHNLEAENAFPMVQKQPPRGVLENFKIGSGTGM